MSLVELRAPQLEDLDAYHEVFSDPQTHRFIIDEGVQNLAGSTSKLTKLIKLHGTSKRVYTICADHQAVGFIVVHIDGSPHPYLSYAVRRTHWRRGIASTAIEKFLRIKHNGCEGFFAATHLENVASQNLLRKVGFDDQGIKELKMGTRRVFKYLVA